MTTKSLLICFALLLAACGEGRARASKPVVRDSAGIQIVENLGPVWGQGEGWHLSEEPILGIGEVEGAPEYQFDRVADALRLADGRIAVSNAGSHELRFYNDSGAYIMAVGGQGGGPGEFEGLTWVARLGGDSLAAYDQRNQRLSVFGPEGTFGRSFTVTAGSSGGHPQARGRFDDGTLLVILGVGYGPDAPAGVTRDSMTLVRFDPETESANVIARVPGAESFVTRIGDGMMITSLVFGRSPYLRVAGDGFYYGFSDRYEIGRYTPNGRLRRLIRRDFANQPVTPEDIGRVKEERISGAGDANWRRSIEKSLAEMPFPTTFPAYAGLRTDDEGNLWVLEHNRPGDEQPRWTVFDPEGRMLGTLAMPERFRPTHIGPDFVLGVWTDELDVEHVRMYALRK